MPPDRGRQTPQLWQASNQAGALAARKQTEPSASGRQTCWFAACAVRSTRIAFPVSPARSFGPALASG